MADENQNNFNLQEQRFNQEPFIFNITIEYIDLANPENSVAQTFTKADILNLTLIKDINNMVCSGSLMLRDISNVFEEISESSVFKERTEKYKEKKNPKVKKSKLTKNKYVHFNPIKYKIEDYTLLVGRNNMENDYLTLKYAKKTDLWFHTKDIHGSHCILVLNGAPIPKDDILLKCAEIAVYHSKARNSSNVPVDFCEVKYVKKPTGAKPGMVIYKNNKTLWA